MNNNQHVIDAKTELGDHPLLTVINYTSRKWRFFRSNLFILFIMSFILLYSYIGNSPRLIDIMIPMYCMVIYFGLLAIFGLETHLKLSLYKKHLKIVATYKSLNAEFPRTLFSFIKYFIPRKIIINYSEIVELIPNMIFDEEMNVSTFSIKLKNGVKYYFYYPKLNADPMAKYFPYLEKFGIEIKTLDDLINLKDNKNYLYQIVPNRRLHPANSFIKGTSNYFSIPDKKKMERTSITKGIPLEFLNFRYWIILGIIFLFYEFSIIHGNHNPSIFFVAILYSLTFLHGLYTMEPNKYISKKLVERLVEREQSEKQVLIPDEQLEKDPILKTLVEKLRTTNNDESS